MVFAAGESMKRNPNPQTQPDGQRRSHCTRVAQIIRVFEVGAGHPQRAMRVQGRYNRAASNILGCSRRGGDTAPFRRPVGATRHCETAGRIRIMVSCLPCRLVDPLMPAAN